MPLPASGPAGVTSCKSEDPSFFSQGTNWNPTRWTIPGPTRLAQQVRECDAVTLYTHAHAHSKNYHVFQHTKATRHCGKLNSCLTTICRQKPTTFNVSALHTLLSSFLLFPSLWSLLLCENASRQTSSFNHSSTKTVMTCYVHKFILMRRRKFPQVIVMPLAN